MVPRDSRPAAHERRQCRSWTDRARRRRIRWRVCPVGTVISVARTSRLKHDAVIAKLRVIVETRPHERAVEDLDVDERDARADRAFGQGVSPGSAAMSTRNILRKTMISRIGPSIPKGYVTAYASDAVFTICDLSSGRCCACEDDRSAPARRPRAQAWMRMREYIPGADSCGSFAISTITAVAIAPPIVTNAAMKFSRTPSDLSDAMIPADLQSQRVDEQDQREVTKEAEHIVGDREPHRPHRQRENSTAATPRLTPRIRIDPMQARTRPRSRGLRVRWRSTRAAAVVPGSSCVRGQDYRRGRSSLSNFAMILRLDRTSRCAIVFYTVRKHSKDQRMARDSSAPKKIVLAYSGGLDTSVILPWLKDRYPGVKLVAFAAELGQGDELNGSRIRRARAARMKCIVKDLRQRICRTISVFRCSARACDLRSRIICWERASRGR